MTPEAVPYTAVILAAGLGSRFGARGLERPKGFIEFGGEAIVLRSIRNMLDAGVRRVVIVTGHLHGFYEELATGLPGVLELVHNPRYADSGSMYSLYQARGALAEDFWLFESDLVYERHALDALRRVAQGSALLMSGPTGSGDEVYVDATAGRLRGLSKDKRQLERPPAGELVGISRISRPCFAAMQAHAEHIFAATLTIEYEQALVAAARSVPVACLLEPELAWSEIDTAEHWNRVHAAVWPLILQRDARRRTDAAGTAHPPSSLSDSPRSTPAT